MNNFLAKINKFLSLFGDIGFLYLSLLLTLLIRYQDGFNQYIWSIHWPTFSGLFFIWLIIFYAFNLYDIPTRRSRIDTFNNYLKAIIINIGISVLYFYILSPETDIKPKTVLAILVIIFSVFFFIWRTVLIKIFSSPNLNQNLLFIGYAPLIKELLPKQGTKQKFGFNYIGIIANQPISDPEIDLPQFPLEELEKVIKQKKINLLVINEPENEYLTNQLFGVLKLRVNFVSLTNFYESNTRRIPLKIISHGWFLDNFSEGNKEVFETIKRLLDVLFAVIFGIISIILIPFIALIISLDSKGKIIFKQIRVGKDSKEFSALKFRTMYRNAEENGAMWAQKNDPRITKFGKFLRKSRLDEIPQLWNILKGEMSFVGPRPERPEFIESLKKDIPFYTERLLVKPGLTGWAQINFPYASSTDDSLKKLQYDLYYIKHRSMILDLSITLKTINIILKVGGR